MKKFRKSKTSVVCYVIALLLAVYFIAVSVSTVITIFNYYASYNVTPGFGEIFGYIMQNGLTSFVSAVLIFMAGRIFDEVRRQNPANFVSDEELEDAREEKRRVRDAKQAAKAEAKAVKTEEEKAAAALEPVEALFAAETAEEAAEATEETVEEVTEEAVEEAAEEEIEEIKEEIDTAAEDILVWDEDEIEK